MMTSHLTTELALRDYPDDDALLSPGKYSKGLSFSPDIIPMYGKTTDKKTLCDPASWRGFSGLPIVGGDDNNVYIRAHGSGGLHLASLRVVPSELILWPHVWYNEKPVPSSPVVISAGDKKGPCAADGPLHFRPAHTTGHTYSLIANVYKHDEKHKDLPLTPPFDLEKGGVDDFISFLENDKTHTFYNVIVADPTLELVSATTRLRMIGKTAQLLSFRVNSHTGSPLPQGVEISLVDDHGKINIPRTKLEHLEDKTVLLDASYDGILMLNVFAPEGHGVYEPYSGLSLQAFKGDALQTGSSILLGALNIIFEHHATRNLRFASPAATQLRDVSVNANVQSLEERGCGPLPVTRPAATGFWTRAGMSDTNHFPHHQVIGHSPDIQPIGINLDKEDFKSTLQDPADYAAQQKISLIGMEKNYIFVRGYSTLVDIDVQAKLFLVNPSTVNHPRQYLRNALRGQVFGDGGEVNSQSIPGSDSESVASQNKLHVFEKPFVIDNPPSDGKHHYCIIAEFRQKRKCCPEFPGWPSDHWNNYRTLADFVHMVMDCPLVCWRNINWQPRPPRGQSAKCWEWSCTTDLNIPDGASYCSFWTIILECENKVIPDGSTWNLVCDDKKIFPDGTCFGNTPLGPGAERSVMGCHFTGAQPGYQAKITVSVTWCDNGDHNIPPPNICWKLAVTETTASPIQHLASEHHRGSENWPFYVTKDYPHIGGTPNPSPLPSFKAHGLNKWPYKDDAVYFPLGQVQIGATNE